MRGRHKPHRSAFLSLIPIVALLVTFVPAPARAVVSEPSAGPSIATQNDGPDSDTLRLLAGMAGKDVLRVKGTFGEFTGIVSRIDANGLSGFRADSRFDGGALAAESVAWSQVTSVERLGTSSRRYAKFGAAIVGGLAGALGALIGAGLGTNDRAWIGGLMFGAVPGALVGAGAGALIGVNVRRWHRVYTSPHAADASARP